MDLYLLKLRKFHRKQEKKKILLADKRGRIDRGEIKRFTPLLKEFLVLLGEFIVYAHEVVGVATGAGASTARLDPEDVVQDGADKVVVEEGAARVAHHEGEGRQTLDVLRAAPEKREFGYCANV